MSIDKIIEKMKQSQDNVSFDDLVKVCNDKFTGGRIAGSHHIYKIPGVITPINIQDDGHGKAKSYQVRQVLKLLGEL
ncbi:hypothetical protein [Chromobacterium violaceum]|uniref:hypothetical protein n=1 Tax=Chromobacterium violaceum TaxID=536 RepID=UPI003DA94521